MNCYLLVMTLDFKTCVYSLLLLSAQKWCLFLNPHFPKNKYSRDPVFADSVSAVYRGPKKKLEN